MALREYITFKDVTNKLFKKPGLEANQVYIDYANEECEDLAKLVGVKPEDITAKTHSKLRDYLTTYSVSRFASDSIGVNNTGGQIAEGDVYDNLFKRSQYQLQRLRLDIVKVIFTGDAETAQNRAVVSQRIRRG